MIMRFYAILLATLAFSTAPAHADYIVSFFAHEHSGDFPHAFITISGAPKGSGAHVEESYGFTVKTLTPAILMGSAPGKVENESAHYIKTSQKQFSLNISDAQYAALKGVVARWQVQPDSVYNLNKHNCVSFVADIAKTLGLSADIPKGLIKHPKAYLETVMRANPSLKP